MFSRITLPVALAATLAIGALPAVAAPQRESQADLTAFSHAKVSLAEAVRTVQMDTGGIVTSAWFHTTPVVGPKPPYGPAAVDGQVDGYLLSYIAGGSMNVSYVNPQTGHTFQTATTGTAGYNPAGIGEAEYLGLMHTAPDLPQAIKMAQQRAGGQAIDAVLMRQDGKLGYRVGVVHDGTISHEWVDPASGRVASLQ